MITELHSSILDNIPIGIIYLDRNNKCLYTNKYVINVLGIKNETEVTSSYFSSIHYDDLAKERGCIISFLQNFENCNNVCRLYNRNFNEYRWTVVNRKVLDDKNYLMTLQDIHENKTMEIRLKEESLKAEQAYNHKSIFLANMSHEIRTPLNGIIGMLTLLEDTVLSNDQQDYIIMVKECSFNLMTIINDILDYSKLEVGKIILDIKPMMLQDCVESVNDIILSKIYEKSLNYSYNIEPTVPQIINCDLNRIKQVLLNLLSNSIKFTERGEITLNITSISEKDYKEFNNVKKPKETNSKEPFEVYLRFDIKDTGCGISQEDRNKLFKSFTQVDNRLTSKIYQGTGLGLVISKEIVELMNGYIWLDQSALGKGSTFSFVIKTTVSKNNSFCIKDECDDILQDMNVIIVDDNLYNRLSLTRMVSKWGMKPHVFTNTEEALCFAKITSFDIGLIDICMPKLDGTHFAMKLREQKEYNNKSIPLIALSSLGDNSSTISPLFDAHVIKPVKENKLRQICIDCLQNKNVIKKENGKRKLLDKKDKIRILLAEDVYVNQKVITSFLQKFGYENIKVVENGRQCLDMLVANEFDVVLLDIKMPILNGENVLVEYNKYIKTKTNVVKPYFIAVTAYCLVEDRGKYINMGFDDYIPKPITLIELENCMNKFLKKLQTK